MTIVPIGSNTNSQKSTVNSPQKRQKLRSTLYSLWTKKGFTLVEVLISVIIISIGGIFILQAFAQEVSALAVSRDSIKATLLLKEKMMELEREINEVGNLNKISLTGKFSEVKEKDFTWVLDLFRCDFSENLIKVRLTCFWQSRGKMRNVTLETFVREKSQ